MAPYAQEMIKEVETIARSVGVSESRQLRRRYVRNVKADRSSVAMSDIYLSYRAGEAVPVLHRPTDAGHTRQVF